MGAERVSGKKGVDLKLAFYPFLLASLALHSFLAFGMRTLENFDFSFWRKDAFEKTSELSQPITLDFVERKKRSFAETSSSSKPSPMKFKRKPHLNSSLIQSKRVAEDEASSTAPQATSPSFSKGETTHLSEGYYHPAPQYPPEALQQQMEGELQVEVHTNNEGLVTTMHLEQSTGHSLLDTEALRVVKEWRLTPNSVFHIPFHFKIVGKSENKIDQGRRE